MNNDNDQDLEYQVVINHEEQYAIWPAFKTLPAGWKAIGPSGSRAVCLEYIEAHWRDMRPLHIRKMMEEPDDQ